MCTLRRIAFAVSALLLQACASPPPKGVMAIQPFLRIEHSANREANTYAQLGRYHQQRGSADLAITAYLHAIALDGRHLDSRNALAAIYARQGRLDEAQLMLQQLVTEFPAVSHPHNNLGYVYYLLGDYAHAIATLQRASLLDPDNERIRNNLIGAQAAASSQLELAKMRQTIDADARNWGKATPLEISSASRPEVSAMISNLPTMEQYQHAHTIHRTAATELSSDVTALAVISGAHVPSAISPQRLPRLELVQISSNVYDLRVSVTDAPSVQMSEMASAAPVVSAIFAPSATRRARKVRVEIANGNGVAGAAKRFQLVLDTYGIVVNQLTNARSFKQKKTEIYYRTGYEQDARAIENALPGKSLLIRANKLVMKTDIRVVLGGDIATNMASTVQGMDDISLVLISQGQVVNLYPGLMM